MPRSMLISCVVTVGHRQIRKIVPLHGERRRPFGAGISFFSVQDTHTHAHTEGRQSVIVTLSKNYFQISYRIVQDLFIDPHRLYLSPFFSFVSHLCSQPIKQYSVFLAAIINSRCLTDITSARLLLFFFLLFHRTSLLFHQIYGVFFLFI